MKHIFGFDLFEGRAYKDTKKKFAKKAWDPDKKADFRDKIKSHIKSLGLTTKQVGNDLEMHDNEGKCLAQIMFREKYIGIKKNNSKFVEEFGYDELGKIKSEINKIK